MPYRRTPMKSHATGRSDRQIERPNTIDGRRSVDQLRVLHWLPVQAGVRYTVSFLRFEDGYKLGSPTYLSSLQDQYTSSRGLHSSQDLLTVPRPTTKTAARRFSSTAPRVWNGLPSAVQAASDNDSSLVYLKTQLYQLRVILLYASTSAPFVNSSA